MTDLLVLILSTVPMVLLGVTVFLRNRYKVTFQLFGVLALTSVAWSLANYFSNHVTGYYIQLVVNKTSLFVGFLLVQAVWLLSLYFPYKFAEHKLQWLSSAIITPVILYITLFTDKIVSSVVYRPDRDITDINTGSLFFLYILASAIFFCFLVYNFLKPYVSHSLSTVQKQQVLFTATGLFLSFIWAVLTAALIPALTNNWEISKYGTVGLWFMLAFTSYAIVKHKLFDIRLIVARSAAYVLSLGSIAITTSFLLFFIAEQLRLSGVSEQWLQALFVLITITLAVSYLPIKKFFDKVTNKLFYRDAYETQDLLNDFNQAIVTTIDLEKLLDKAAQVIEKYLRPEFSAFGLIDSKNGTIRLLHNGGTKLSVELMEQIRSYVKKGDKVVNTDLLEDEQKDLKALMQQAEGALLVRITKTTNTEGIGYMMLGYKKTGSVYNSQDTAAIEIIANELAIATENALRFEEIQNFAKTLQAKVDEATRDLRKANERLKELDQTKDDFISMASHQLRTPLTSVKGYVSMVLEGDAGKVSTKQKELLDQAFLSSQRMVYLIADLLNISRLKTGKFVIEPKETNLAEVVEGEIAQLKETAKAKDLELTYQKPKTFPSLMLDETKIRQVIMNFADNAVHYTPAGGHIQVALADKGDSVEFTVTDDGIGVPKAEQHHMFNKFYRADNAKKARPDGTGLGLFMAKKVIVAQGGSIIFKSTEGKGSSFGFSFAKKALLPENYKGPIPDKKPA